MDQPPQDVSSLPDADAPDAGTPDAGTPDADAPIADAPIAGRPHNGQLPAGWLSQVWSQLQQLAPETGPAPHPGSSLDIVAWLALAEARGATPLAGPLRHDLLLRAGAPDDGPARCGLNVFSRNRQQDDQALQLVRAQALRWGCLPACEALLRALPKGLRYHAGFVCGPHGDTIKLYLAADERRRENERRHESGRSHESGRRRENERGRESGRGQADGAVRRAMAVLGLERPDEVFALGIDLRPSGWTRARSYQPYSNEQHQNDALSSTGNTRLETNRHSADESYRNTDRRHAAGKHRWAAAESWMALSAEGVAHRVLAQLDAAQANDGLAKRSYDIIFTPDATLAGLFEVTAAIVALDSACRPQLAQERLLQADQRLQSIGLTLRPAAYEVDVFADGRRATDTLLTIGVRASINDKRHSSARGHH